MPSQIHELFIIITGICLLNSEKILVSETNDIYLSHHLNPQTMFSTVVDLKQRFNVIVARYCSSLKIDTATPKLICDFLESLLDILHHVKVIG